MSPTSRIKRWKTCSRRRATRCADSAPRTSTPSMKCPTVRTSSTAPAACRSRRRWWRAPPTPATARRPASGRWCRRRATASRRASRSATPRTSCGSSSSIRRAGAPWPPAARSSRRNCSGRPAITPPNTTSRQLVPANLVIGKDTRITPPGEMARAMNQGDISWLLSRADRDPDGSYRVILSKATPGRPVGRIRFHGTRADDPNDVIPHEHRRELRGYFVFAAWLNHVDAKGINSLSSLITENGRSFIRNYLLDFGSALGSAAVGPREGWEGYEALVEQPGEIGKRVAVVRVQGAGVADAGLFRVAGDRPPAARSLEVGSRNVVAAHHQRGVPPHAPGRHVLGGDEAGRDHRRHDPRRGRRRKVRRHAESEAVSREGDHRSPAAHPADVPAEGESDCRCGPRCERPADLPQRRVGRAPWPTAPRAIGRFGTRSTTPPTGPRWWRRPKKPRARC